jgi:hypothetical protein
VKSRVARGASIKLSLWSCVEALTERSYAHFVISGIVRLEEKSWEPRLTNSRVASCDECLWNWALVIALWSHERAELMPSVVYIGELPKGPVDRLKLIF